jgi:two-component system CheB/CheR fusion protein
LLVSFERSGGLFGRRRKNSEEQPASIRHLHEPSPGEISRKDVELSASKEAVSCFNEELQSTNEELEASREELQSLIEELNTVNAQLQVKVEEQERTMNDLANLLDSTDIATLFLDRDLRVKWFTPAAAQMFHLQSTDVGRPIGHFAHGFTDGDLQTDAGKVLASHETVASDVQDGAGHWFVRRSLPYRSTDDQVEGVVVTFIDVHKLRQSQIELSAQAEELQEAKEVAEAANEAKDHFLSMLSHELRTPLNPVVLELEALHKRPDLPGDVRGALTVVLRNVEVELRLLNELLDLVRIGRGKLEVKPSPVEVHGLLESVVGICRGPLEGRDLRVELRIESEAPTFILADEVRLEQALWNLLSNAIKFSPAGSMIRLRYGAQGDDVVFEVIDVGSGISSELLPTVFEPFVQGDPLGNRGLGLGLALAKSIVQAHGGRLDAWSAGVGKGSTMTICLPKAMQFRANSEPVGGARAQESPLPTSESLQEAQPQPSPKRTARLLVVEDHLDSADSLSRLLRARGYEVEVARDLAGAREVLQLEGFDLVLCDLSLPDGDGYELLPLLQDKGTGALALSGHGLPKQIKKSQGAGFLAHLVKPIQLDLLFQELEKALSRN